MIQNQTQGEAIRGEFLKIMRLSKKNRQIADIWLDMEQPEEEAVLVGIGHQDLSQIAHYLGEYADYPDWLRKKKRVEELRRYVRFVVEVGGSTACELLVRFSPTAGMPDLMRLLTYLTGEHAGDQKLAVQAGFCTLALLRMRPADVKALCESGAEDPEIFLRAARYCYDTAGAPGAERWSRSRLLLQAMYLHHKEAGTAPETAEALVRSLTAAIAGLMAFSKGELRYIQDFVRTAGQDTPFPQRILSIYQERKSGINPSLIAGCAFLALDHSVQFEILLRLMTAVDRRFQGRNLALETCMGITEADWFDAHMGRVEEMLPILDEDYILWCLQTGYPAGAERMARKCPEGIRAAAEKAGSAQFEELMEILDRAVPGGYEELRGASEGMFREKLAAELVSRVYPGRGEAKQYLLGTCTVDVLLPYMKEWGYDFYQDEERFEKIEALKRRPDHSMYRRAVVLEALKKEPDYLSRYPVREEMEKAAGQASLLFDEQQIRRLLRLFGAEQVPVLMQMEALGGLCKSMSGRTKKELLLERFVKILTEYGKESGMEAWEQSLTELVANSSKQSRTLLLRICRAYPEWKPKILTMLGSRKLKEREFAAALLEAWRDSSCLPDVKAALDREKNQKLKAVLEGLIEELEQEAAGADAEGSGRTEERLAAEIFRGNRKRKVEWVQSLSLPEVRRKDGEIVSPDYLSAILASYADMDPLGIHPDAKKLAKPLDQESLADYLLALYEGWMSAGAEAKKRWVLYAVSIHGGARMLPILHSQSKDWAEHQRGAMAAEAVQAMALNESPEALTLVDQMSRKGKTRQIKNAAKAALQSAASALGIRREELEDRLVPDLAAEELTKRQLREIRSGQKLRLEQALFSARLWEAADWRTLFIQKPVMHLFASGLIWGVYEEQKCRQTFRYLEDGTFSTAEGEEYVLPEKGQIGLAHPLELTAKEMDAWKEQLSDYEVSQPFEQLDRPVYKVTEEERQEYAISRFEDRMLHGMALSGKLLGMGWVRGAVLDAGFFENYYRMDGEFGAELTFSGSSIGFEDQEVTIQKVYFYRFSQDASECSVQERFREENLCLPGDVSERYFSEVLCQIGKAANISSEKADI